MVLEEHTGVSKLACEERSLKFDIGHLYPSSAKRDWGSKGLDGHNCRALWNSLELVVEHDLLTSRIEFFGRAKVEAASKPLLVRNFGRRDY